MFRLDNSGVLYLDVSVAKVPSGTFQCCFFSAVPVLDDRLIVIYTTALNLNPLKSGLDPAFSE